jgi:hypothetical protein
MREDLTFFRVPGFLSSRPNWAPHPSTPIVSFATHLWVQGGRHTRLRKRGPHFDEETETLILYSMYCIMPCPTPFLLVSIGERLRATQREEGGKEVAYAEIGKGSWTQRRRQK